MKTVKSASFLLGALALIWPAQFNAAAANAPASLYAKRDTWSETLIASRQTVLRWQSDHLDEAATRELTGIWGRFSADFPSPARWISRDTGTGKELSWLVEKAGQPILEPLIRRALSSTGRTPKDFSNQIDHLRSRQLSGDDAPWFDLYSRLCHFRDCLPALDRIWVLDVRRRVQSECEQFLSEPGLIEASWKTLHGRLERINEALGSGVPFDLSTARDSIENLAETSPSFLSNKEELIGALKEQQPRWQEWLETAAQGQEQALDQLGTVAEEIRQFRRDLLLAHLAMKAFLRVPGNYDLDQEWEGQFEVLQHDLGNRAHFARVVKETFRAEALVLESDRDPADVVLRRASALLADLENPTPPRREPDSTTELARKLAELREVNSQIDLCDREARYLLFANACRVRREIAFRNPLLNFEEILFIKRHRA